MNRICFMRFIGEIQIYLGSGNSYVEPLNLTTSYIEEFLMRGLLTLRKPIYFVVKDIREERERIWIDPSFVMNDFSNIFCRILSHGFLYI